MEYILSYGIDYFTPVKAHDSTKALEAGMDDKRRGGLITKSRNNCSNNPIPDITGSATGP
jgi:hypothetical protein